MILGIETSCDECSAALVEDSRVIAVSTFSQIEIHSPYGGVVPEIASRSHLETLLPRIDQVFEKANLHYRDVTAIAVTSRPGLVGALLVGVSTAKALAYAFHKPLIAVNHLEGHAASIYLREDETPSGELSYPLLLAIVSGGHTQLYVIQKPIAEWDLNTLSQSLVGRSRDDAAGEAFDKIAKVLGLGYPGGAKIDELAKQGQRDRFALPRALKKEKTLDLSFSGIKTAAFLLTEKLKKEGTLTESLPDVCASVQEAILETLCLKLKSAIETYGCQSLSIVGGVAANSRLRHLLGTNWKAWGLNEPPFFPALSYCSDNAAMIAAAGEFRFKQGHFLNPSELLLLNAVPYSKDSP